MTKRTSPKKPSRPYHHGDMRTAVIAAALKLIVARGDVTFTVREIAVLVGVSHTALYRHFDSKKAVLAAVAEEGYRELIRRLAAADEVDKMIQDYIAFAVSHPGYFRAMYHAELGQKEHFPVLNDLAAQAGQRLIDVVASSEKPGWVRSNDQINAMVSACWALAHGMSDLIIAQQLPAALLSDPNQLSQRVHAITGLLLSGLHS